MPPAPIPLHRSVTRLHRLSLPPAHIDSPLYELGVAWKGKGETWQRLVLGGDSPPPKRHRRRFSSLRPPPPLPATYPRSPRLNISIHLSHGFPRGVCREIREDDLTSTPSPAAAVGDHSVPVRHYSHRRSPPPGPPSPPAVGRPPPSRQPPTGCPSPARCHRHGGPRRRRPA
jgi:hypothetical protein